MFSVWQGILSFDWWGVGERASCISSITSDRSTGGVYTYVSAQDTEVTGTSIKKSTVTTTLDPEETVIVLAEYVQGFNFVSSSNTSPASAPTGFTSCSENHGLSSGARTGIGIEVAFGVIFVISMLALLWFRHRRRKGLAAQMGKRHGEGS
ncbi:hypothetical protein N7532_006097 [Penicillium argentinense]|uniref:Uncharacterized protein n=1 Tax=Penicillium argentinense TaxID=1131581 RepID=A0A9W9FF95_9EURO|nr:uncharacterized protein N7532_006097 [Penicillium argentinense]KAJ5099096.1 hypothetical protein N7532_006097 [Penicillium argentinense]